MRTKTLLLTAALGAAGIASSMAQVYSANAVGYVNLSLGSGFTIIANPLNGTNNHLNTILPLPDTAAGTILYRFNPLTQGYVTATFFGSEDGGWFSDSPANLILNPGEGAFIRVEGPTPLNITFVGEVPQGNLSHNIQANFSIQASEVPQALPVGPAQTSPTVATLGFPATEGDIIYVFDSATQGYKVYSYFADFGWSSGVPGSTVDGPVIPVGTGFFVDKVATTAWSRNFTVN
jgi:hypothetical protein